MTTSSQRIWGGSLHQTFRLLNAERIREPSAFLSPFLSADGYTPDAVLDHLPYAAARSRSAGSTRPDPRRYRDYRQVLYTSGLAYEDSNRVCITALGHATLRWLSIINDKNATVIGRHAAYALAACQLREPSRAGTKFDFTWEVFPFSFIWRAMLALDGRISSNELRRGLFQVRNEQDLSRCIDKIAEARRVNDIEVLGPDPEPSMSNDRVIPWIAIASFGFTLITDKRNEDASGYYIIPPRMVGLLTEASRIRHKHRTFATTTEYAKYIARCAALPEDRR